MIEVSTISCISWLMSSMPSVTGNDSIDAVRHDNFAVIKTEVMLSVEVLDAIVPCPAIGLNTL